CATFHNAAAAALCASMRCPATGPQSNSAVETASEALAVLATTLTAKCVFNGTPLSGSTMCPAKVVAKRLGGVRSDVVRLSSDITIVGSICCDGSRMCTSHPVLPGGDPRA